MADLKTLLGDSYKDDMTVEEITKALIDVDPTKGLIKKDLFDRTASELATAKKQLKEKLTDDEKAKADQDTFKEQLATLQKENAQMKLKENFTTNGYDAKTAIDLAAAYSEGDMNKFATVNATFMANKEKTLQTSIKEDLLKKTPGIHSGDPNTAVDYTKQIGEAQARGDMPTVAALIRQRAESKSKGE